MSLTSSFSPLNRLSRLTPTMNSMNRGDTAMAIDLNQLSGTSSNSILTARNPPEMDSMTCRSQTMSLGMFSPTRESTRLSRPQPFSRPMLASRIMSRARTVLRCPRDRSFHLLNCDSSISATGGYTTHLTLSMDGNHCWGAPRQVFNPPWCFTFPVISSVVVGFN